MSDAPETKQTFSPTRGLKKLPPMSGAGHKHKYDQSNEKFAKENMEFQSACDKAGVKATKRQASKWRNKKGLAHTKGRF